MADGDQALIPVAPDALHPLGRHVWHDPRNREHRAYTVAPDRPDKYSLWYTGDVYDQGHESDCTTEAALGVCRTTPVRFQFTRASWSMYDTEAKRAEAYRSWQRFDPPDWGPHDGSATDSPYKGLRELGQISGWKWLFGIDEVRQWVMYDGPCSVGTIWLDSMFHPNSYNYIPVDRVGHVAGGHEYRIISYSPGRQAFRVVNSWGRTWGAYGRAWLRNDDLAWLLDQQGDAVTVTP